MVAALYSCLLFCLVLTALAGVVKNEDKPAPSPTVDDANNKNMTVADAVNKNITVADAVNKNVTVPDMVNNNMTVDVASNKTIQNISNIAKNLTCNGYECCPSPYTNVKDECFYVSQDRMKWYDARAHCYRIQGDLVVPKNLIALKDFIFQISGGLKVFVGGWDATQNGHFKWLNDTPIGVHDWAKGEPDHVWDDEFCLGFHAGMQPMLFDKNCDNILHFVCQYHFPE